MKKEFFITDEEIALDDESIYSKNVREQLLEDDELSPTEAAFMQGYDEAYT
jgi:hypothetical protein|tara:strand:+ start:8842 stop:8994 length:153 start_codon:yes stop_codon:yes gene_type:complete